MNNSENKYTQIQLIWTFGVALAFAAVALQHAFTLKSASLNSASSSTNSEALLSPSLPDGRTLR